MNAKRASLFLCFFVAHVYLVGQQILPFIENFSKQDYRGENQIWSIAQGSDAALYFANNLYLMRYNGVRWEKYSLPNRTIIRSVFVRNDTVFTGSLTEFGYWNRKNGLLQYTSLSEGKNFFTESSRNSEIWKIFEFEGKLFFQGFNVFFHYSGGEISEVKLPGQISYCYVVESKLYAATIDRGIFEYTNDEFIQVKKWNLLQGHIVHHIDEKQGKTYFFTHKSGVFVCSNGALGAWGHTINQQLNNELIITAKFIDEHRVAIGTASRGLYIVDLSGGQYFNINRNSGILNNSILSIFQDKENDLWLGLDNGIAHVEVNSPYSLFTDRSGMLGSVYSIALTDKGFLLGSNHGVFDYTDQKLNMVENSQGQVWNIFRTGQNYLVGHNDGTFLLSENGFEKINEATGGWQVKRDVYRSGFFQANYTGMVRFESNQDITKNKRLAIPTNPIKDFVQISANEIIASYSSKGLSVMTFDTDFTLLSIENITHKQGIEKDFGVKIFEFKNQPLFYIDNTWYFYDRITGRLEKYTLFNMHFRDIDEIIPVSDSLFAVIKNEKLYLLKNQADKFSWRLIPLKYYKGRLINKETKFFEYGNHFLVNLDDGFMLIDKNIKPYNEKQVEIEVRVDATIIEQGTKVPNNANLNFDFVSPYYGNKKVPISYKINNDPIQPLDKDVLELRNMQGGSYILTAYFQDGFKFQELAAFRWRVAYPPYVSPWMIVLYCLILVLGLFIYYRWNKLKFRQRLQLREEELKHQNEIARLELLASSRLKTEEYEKELLKSQVQIKANELAGKSLTLVKQTELLDKIQTVINAASSPDDIKGQIAKIIKANHISKNEWKSFENNLLKSNEDFVRKLTAHYPVLTSKDIKLAIFLKMNLSSKEIAPLMNIGYRGVELHRYRLRKKMNLPASANFPVFLNNL